MLSKREKEKENGVYMHIGVCPATLHVSFINLESSCILVLNRQFTPTALPSLPSSSALHRRFLHRSLWYTMAPSFPGFFLNGRNHRFSAFVLVLVFALALESLSGKTFSLLLVRRSS